MVRKIVQELNGFDNVYFEICNEPYERGGQTIAWQDHVAQVIVDTEKSLPVKHMIAQNLRWQPYYKPGKPAYSQPPNRHVSVMNFHGSGVRLELIADYYDFNRPIAFDETSRGDNDKYRTEAWSFLIGGGAVYDNLDLCFAVGYEDGTSKRNHHWGGGPPLLRQLTVLMDFMSSFDFVKMKPDDSVVKSPPADERTTITALDAKGRAYAIYINGGNQIDLTVELGHGKYVAQWIDTKTGNVAGSETFQHSGGNRTLRCPDYVRDIALRIVKSQSTGQ
jgi:hypothetical protein